MEFHEKLQELRKQKNLTQEELSEILFVSRTAISKWESGRGYPSFASSFITTYILSHKKEKAQLFLDFFDSLERDAYLRPVCCL